MNFPEQKHQSKLSGLMLGALGVVYGDIGTSPLYALQEVFHHASPTRDNVLGVLSMVFWTLTIIVSLKYVALILRADNNGEGGTMALMALASKVTEDRPKLRWALIMMGLMGAALFYGDGVITPAISVLSAVEGLKLAMEGVTPFIVPITLIILTTLYAVQRHGTGMVGKFFGPITLLWFAVISYFGLLWILQHPTVLFALNPWYALSFAQREGLMTLVVLGSVFLTVTGAEALYADMGHFGKTPIRFAWFMVVFPALVLNYFGQGALLLSKPEAANNPFFNLVPSWFLLPMVGLATLATVIASQATISGTYSVTKQSIQLGYLPRMRILHTSEKETGQIYIPAANWLQYSAIVLAVGLFQSSSALASAYGIAVTATMVITTLMAFIVIRYRWRYPLWVCVGATLFFLIIELVFFGANILKIVQGGWFTLMIAGVIFIIMTTWSRGRALLRDRLRDDSIPLKDFLQSIENSPPLRVPGTAVFLAADSAVTPNALLHNLKHNMVLHEQNLFVTVQHHEIPWVADDQRYEVTSLGPKCWQIIMHFGFKNEPNVPLALQLLGQQGIVLNPMSTSYFLSRDIVIPTIGSGMAPWREKLFANMHRNASSVADFLYLPANRVVELGSKVEI